MQPKKLYKCQAFSWVYGERVVHKEKYIRAYSRKQAVLLAFANEALREDWSISITEVGA